MTAISRHLGRCPKQHPFDREEGYVGVATWVYLTPSLNPTLPYSSLNLPTPILSRRSMNLGAGGFVKMPASWSSDFTNWTSTRSSDCCLRTKWHLTSMCFERWWNSRFFTNFIALWLSQKIGTVDGVSCCPPLRSFARLLIHNRKESKAIQGIFYCIRERNILSLCCGECRTFFVSSSSKTLVPRGGRKCYRMWICGRRCPLRILRQCSQWCLHLCVRRAIVRSRMFFWDMRICVLQLSNELVAGLGKI